MPPEDDGSRGELTVGPGVGGIQPRWSECKRALPGLTLDQEERLKRSKRFAMEQSVQQVLVFCIAMDLLSQLAVLWCSFETTVYSLWHNVNALLPDG